jgi:1,4-dihydroxy-2-naphthoate octaprenyltransferase
MRDAKYVLGPMRLPFLLLTPACVLLGIGAALRTSGRLNALEVILVLVGGVAAHTSVNAFNEYCDFRSGLDARTARTPFSGGSGTLPAKPEMAGWALLTAGLTLGVAAGIGVYFVLLRGLGLLPVGLLGLFVIVAYTPWLTHRPVLCLLAPGVGFGPFMVLGTQFALTGGYSWSAFVASLVPFFLVSDLLLLNQFPDIDADRSVGRRHVLIVLGSRGGSLIYGLFLLLTYLAILGGVVWRHLPAMCSLGLTTLALAIPAAIGAFRYAETIEKLIPYLAMNVILTLATPVLVAIGLFIG